MKRPSPGPYLDRAPDLVLVSHDGSDLKGAMANPELTGKGPLTGMHTRDNAFVMVRGRHPEGVADVQDVAATVLDALGLDPGGVDGRVLAQAPANSESTI